MSNLKNSSELLESATLLEQLLGDPAKAQTENIDLISLVSSDTAVREIPEPLYTQVPTLEAVAPPPNSPLVDVSYPRMETRGRHDIREFRDNKLEDILGDMCRQGGMIGSLLADINGLPIASYRSPVDNEVFAAFASVLGETMDKAGYFLDQHDANYISVDINYADKAVVKKFIIDDAIFYLIIITPKHINERGQVEYTIEKLKNVLSLG